MISKFAALFVPTFVPAVCLISSAIAQPPLPKSPTAIPPPQPFVPREPPETPEKALSEFVKAINQADWPAASARVHGGKPEAELKPIVADLEATYANWRLEIDRQDIKTDDDFADCKIRLRLKDQLGNRISHEENLSIQLDNKTWKIVPIMPERVHQAFWGNLDSDILENLATCFSYPRFIGQSKAMACMSNLKQLGLAAMQFVQDYDEKYALKANLFADYLRPYFRSEDVLVCPLHPKEKLSYVFNAKLQNANLAQMQQPAQTVLIYEGQNEKLDFRHDNRAGVCFADGHVQLVTPEEAPNLRWTL